MSTKFMNFLTMTWFLSTLICLVLEGSYFGTVENSVLNDLSLLATLRVGGLVTIPVPNIFFFRGVMRVLLMDYSFYEGGYQILRYFWLAVLTPGAVWGIGREFVPVFTNLLRIF